MTTTSTKTRWLASAVMAVGLGTAIVTGNAVASADTNTTGTNAGTETANPTTPPKTVVSGGVLNGKAISKPQPAYPPIT